jgi:Phage integrase family.
MRFHDLRHLNASVMVALGVPDKYAMERGGWSTPEVLQSVYQHTFSAERQQVDSAMDNYFSGIMQHEMQHEIKKPR